MNYLKGYLKGLFEGELMNYLKRSELFEGELFEDELHDKLFQGGLFELFELFKDDLLRGNKG